MENIPNRNRKDGDRHDSEENGISNVILRWEEMKARKKPVVVEAMEFTYETKDQVYNFVRCTTSTDWEDGEPVLKIQTLEGVMTARLGDYIIKGVNGEFYPCKPDIFEKTYELID